MSEHKELLIKKVATFINEHYTKDAYMEIGIEIKYKSETHTLDLDGKLE